MWMLILEGLTIGGLLGLTGAGGGILWPVKDGRSHKLHLWAYLQ